MFKNILLIAFFGLTFGACANNSASLLKDGNWADITLEAKGISGVSPSDGNISPASRIELYRAAKADLYKKLESDILSLKIDPRKDVNGFIGENPKLREKVAAFLRNTKINEATFTPGKGMELTGQIYLGESFKSVLGLMEKKVPEEKGGQRPASSGHGSGF